ncbi:hypothetical protein TNCV_1509321 [Trichonephila clavipes]|nr:hypothetical protein TNCV_1509321 [Trichonephila clavipes]
MGFSSHRRCHSGINTLNKTGLVVRESTQTQEGLGSMPDATKYPQRHNTEYVLVKSVRVRMSCGLKHKCRGTEEYFPPIQFHA